MERNSVMELLINNFGNVSTFSIAPAPTLLLSSMPILSDIDNETWDYCHLEISNPADSSISHNPDIVKNKATSAKRIRKHRYRRKQRISALEAR